MPEQISKSIKYKVTIERVTSIEVKTDEKVLEWVALTKEGNKEINGWAEHPSKTKTRVYEEKLTLLSQELDEIDFPLVVRAINFPKDFGFKKEEGAR